MYSKNKEKDTVQLSFTCLLSLSTGRDWKNIPGEGSNLWPMCRGVRRSRVGVIEQWSRVEGFSSKFGHVEMAESHSKCVRFPL